MNFTLKSAAEYFNGWQYPLRLSDDEVAALSSAGLAIVFGESDDLVEIRGAIKDEACSYSNRPFWIGSSGFLPIDEDGELESPEDLRTIQDAKRLVSEYDRSLKIVVQHDMFDYAWVISISEEVAVPHAVFDVFEGSDLFCRALVIQVPQTFIRVEVRS